MQGDAALLAKVACKIDIPLESLRKDEVTLLAKVAYKLGIPLINLRKNGVIEGADIYRECVSAVAIQWRDGKMKV